MNSELAMLMLYCIVYSRYLCLGTQGYQTKLHKPGKSPLSKHSWYQIVANRLGSGNLIL